jgi:hypothetical protein
VVFGTAGDTDFNYIELKLLDNALKDAAPRRHLRRWTTRCRPDDLAMEAIEWLELRRSAPASAQGTMHLLQDALAEPPDRGHRRRRRKPVLSVERLRRAASRYFKGLRRRGRPRRYTIATLLKNPETKRALDRKRKRGPRRRDSDA